jgi:short-subunit dehydrogenase
LIGSTWGVDNHNGKELVFSATKYALRGIAQSLREILRNDLIGVSVLNLGYLATEYEVDVPTATVLAETNHALIPLSDVILAIKFIISTSNASCVKEILMPAMKDENI